MKFKVWLETTEFDKYHSQRINSKLNELLGINNDWMGKIVRAVKTHKAFRYSWSDPTTIMSVANFVASEILNPKIIELIKNADSPEGIFKYRTMFAIGKFLDNEMNAQRQKKSINVNYPFQNIEDKNNEDSEEHYKNKIIKGFEDDLKNAKKINKIRDAKIALEIIKIQLDHINDSNYFGLNSLMPLFSGVVAKTKLSKIIKQVRQKVANILHGEKDYLDYAFNKELVKKRG